MIVAEPQPPRPRDVAGETRIRTFIRRRRRFWRSVALFMLAAIVMVLLTLVNRDTQRLRAVRTEADRIAAALQASATEHGDLPLRLPEIAGASAALYQSYYFNVYYVGQSKWSNPVGVCCQKSVVHLYVRANGRAVVLYDGKTFSARWFTESEFRARAESLGLGATLNSSE